MAIPSLAVATDRTWTNGSNSGLWGTATNWSGNTMPGSGDNADFGDPPGGGTVDLGGVTRTINTLHFSNTLSSYTLTDGTLALSQIMQDADVTENTIGSTTSINASTFTMNVSGGLLQVAGKITASNLAVFGSEIELQNTGNAISTISNYGLLDGFDPGSLGAATMMLNGGSLGLFSDISNANYGNNITVNGSGKITAAIKSIAGPTNNTFQLGALAMNSNAQLTFGSQNNYSIAFPSTSISGSATFVGTQDFLGDGVGQLQLGTVSESISNSSITLNGIGEVLLNHSNNYSGGTFVNGGMLLIGASGATGSAAVNVYSGGAVSIPTALASLPTLNIGAGGAANAAISGNLTGAIYSGGSENVFLSPGSIIAATAGPVPVRGVDVSNAAYYLGITSDTQNVTVGEDSGHTSIYMGAAFGLYTPATSKFSGTISAAQTGENLPIYITPGAQEFSNAKFNTTDTTTGVDFFGPGEVVFDNAPAGSATVFTENGNGAPTQGSFLLTLMSASTLASGKTFNVSNGIAYLGASNTVANGAMMNINTGATLFLDPSVIFNGPSTGTFNINNGGALYLAGGTATPGHGATFTFASGSLVVIGGNLSTGSPTFLPTNSDVVLDAAGDLAVTGTGIVIGNGRRLTTSANNSVTLTGGTGISAAAGASSVTITASGPSSVLQINDPVSLASTDLQIGDSNSFTTTSFTTRVSEPQNGTVILNNNADAVKDLSMTAGTLVVGQTAADHFSTGNYTQSGGTATFHGQLQLTGALTITAGATHLAANLGASPADSAASLSLSFTSGATLDIGDNIINLTSATASAIRADILPAFDTGLWDGAGLTSSLIPAHFGTAIGYKTTGSAGTVRLTWLGDANLDGVVNAADLGAMSSSGTSWQTGDFNYDGVVNADDYTLFMLGNLESGGANISTTLPEPVGTALLAGLVLAILIKRNKPSLA